MTTELNQATNFGERKPVGSFFTVGELRVALADLPAETEFAIGICDAEFGISGGVFANAEELQGYGGNFVQLVAWKKIAKEET